MLHQLYTLFWVFFSLFLLFYENNDVGFKSNSHRYECCHELWFYFIFLFLRWKALNCKNYIIVLIFLYYAESRSLVKYDDCAFWELDTQNLMTGEKRGRRNIAISKISEMLVWMLCVHSGFPLIINGCWNSLLTESAGSAAIVVPVQAGGWVGACTADAALPSCSSLLNRSRVCDGRVFCQVRFRAD